jgi:hypothetical protein
MSDDVNRAIKRVTNATISKAAVVPKVVVALM